MVTVPVMVAAVAVVVVMAVVAVAATRRVPLGGKWMPRPMVMRLSGSGMHWIKITATAALAKDHRRRRRRRRRRPRVISTIVFQRRTGRSMNGVTLTGMTWGTMGTGCRPV